MCIVPRLRSHGSLSRKRIEEGGRETGKERERERNRQGEREMQRAKGRANGSGRKRVRGEGVREGRE